MIKIVMLVGLLLSLTGCLYPDELRYENQIPIEENVKMVQKAIDEYKQKTDVLPIKTKDDLTPIYQKYVVDFTKLGPSMLSHIPADAFEVGGSHVYVLIDVEVKPTVKLLDLVTTQTIGHIQSKVSEYFSRTGRYPFGQELSKGFYLLQFKLMNMEDQQVKSPYSDNYLPIIINESGEVGVDYSIDLMAKIKQAGLKGDSDRDLRTLLTKDSLFVPGQSFTYQLQHGEPILTKNRY